MTSGVPLVILEAKLVSLSLLTRLNPTWRLEVYMGSFTVMRTLDPNRRQSEQIS